MGGFTETEKMKRHVEQCDQCKIAHLASNGIAYSECCDTYTEMFENVIDFECGDDIGYWLTEKMVAAAEAEGETAEFAGTCPDCRKDDPFLKFLDERGIPTVGRDFARKTNR